MAGAVPRILLLGDSIRLSYQEIVAALLKSQADVVFPEANGADTRNTLAALGGWLDEFKPDAVHFNCGLHDLKLARPERARHQVELAEYRVNLMKIVELLAARCPGQVAWATCTPVVEAWHQPAKDFDRLNSDVDAYNAAARAVVAAAQIPVTDLHAVVVNGPAERLLLSGDGVHFNDAGRVRLAEAVTATLRRMLGIHAEQIAGR